MPRGDAPWVPAAGVAAANMGKRGNCTHEVCVEQYDFDVSCVQLDLLLLSSRPLLEDYGH